MKGFEMKLRGIVISCVCAIAACVGTHALAADTAPSADEFKKVVEERDSLKKALDQKNDELSTEASTWFNVGLKAWSATLQQGDGVSRTAGTTGMLSLTAGYGKFFLNYSMDGGGNYKNPNSTETVTRFAPTYVVGYALNSDWLFAIGLKQIVNDVVDIPAPYVNTIYTPELWFTTLGAGYSHSFEDTPYSINSVFTYGQADQSSAGALSNKTGSKGGASTFIGFELGGSYSLSKSFKVGAFYRLEQWDQLTVTSYYSQPDAQGRQANLAMTKATLGGPGLNVSYSF